MTDDDAVAGEADLVWLVPLARDGHHYAAFFGRPGSQEPERAVTDELRAQARRMHRGQERSLLVEVWNEAQSGLVGAAAVGLTGKALTATRNWIREQRRRPELDAETVTARTRKFWAAMNGRASVALQITNVARQPDGMWRIEAVADAKRVEAIMDPTGSLLEWRRLPGPGE
ncbi:hypothetical protein [Streptomyces sp. NPDC006446]|uniref:hypothetical protein n=1 Tax=Streptomyces sp. NPDC006446 TaxID=3154301 RepID=UPI00339F601F